MNPIMALALGIGIFYLFYTIQGEKSKEATAAANTGKKSFTYNNKSHLLVLKNRAPILQSSLTVEAHHEVNITSVPDKLVYTGATVGGITTGGFHVQKGGNYLSLGRKTGEYYITYKYAESYEDGGIRKYRSDSISFIELSESDFALAEKDRILKQYIASPETKETFSRFYNCNQLASCAHLLYLSHLSRVNAEYIVKWMAGYN